MRIDTHNSDIDTSEPLHGEYSEYHPYTPVRNHTLGTLPAFHRPPSHLPHHKWIKIENNAQKRTSPLLSLRWRIWTILQWRHRERRPEIDRSISLKSLQSIRFQSQRKHTKL